MRKAFPAIYVGFDGERWIALAELAEMVRDSPDILFARIVAMHDGDLSVAGRDGFARGLRPEHLESPSDLYVPEDLAQRLLSSNWP